MCSLLTGTTFDDVHADAKKNAVHTCLQRPFDTPIADN